ncbi:Carnitine O-palmitoyltransferase 1, muscle isoform [Exaiptasia diaphana]|nr:Carnitine O-palmitoyltransferase 1, muscle isoform [Exaiptasia diaphana]
MVTTHYSVSEPELMNMISPGGGFGPVHDDGYGVSYMVPDDNRIFFHVSSKNSSSVTNSDRFVKLLFQSLGEMKALFDKDVENGRLQSCSPKRPWSDVWGDQGERAVEILVQDKTEQGPKKHKRRENIQVVVSG